MGFIFNEIKLMFSVGLFLVGIHNISFLDIQQEPGQYLQRTLLSEFYFDDLENLILFQYFLFDEYVKRVWIIENHLLYSYDSYVYITICFN